MTNLRRPACMTPAQAARFGTKHWWWVLDKDTSTMLKLGWHDASGALELSLRPGSYLLGAGPSDHYREHIEIGVDGLEVKRVEVPAELGGVPCIRPGCAGAVDAPGQPCEAFELDPPADRLCQECRP